MDIGLSLGNACLGLGEVIGEQLRSGGFGRVHLAKSESGGTAVIKLIPKTPGAGLWEL